MSVADTTAVVGGVAMSVCMTPTVPAGRRPGHGVPRRVEVPQSAPRSGRSARGGLEAQVLEHGADAAIVVVVRHQAELREDGGHVLLDAAPAEPELLTD